MSLIKDFNYWELQSTRKRYWPRTIINPRKWLYNIKHRHQRAERGWSDRDTWGGGEYIARITADILQHLNDNNYTDWPEWFKLNVKEGGKGAYKSLQEVIDDINNYLEFTETSWADGLTSARNPDKGKYLLIWMDKDGNKLTEATVRHRLNKHIEMEQKLYKKAIKAMSFFSRHFAQFWD